MQPLPEPAPGDPEALAWLVGTFRFDDPDRARDLLEGVLVSWLRPAPPYFVMDVTGEQGSGKSTLCRFLISLLDPRAVLLDGLPREERDLMIRARRVWVLAFTNVSVIPGWLSDSLCRIASGEGWGTRRLFTDDEFEPFEGGRPILLNGIVDLAGKGGRPDLADRTISLLLHPIPDNDRRPEEELLAEFGARRPRILGALYDRVARALAEQASVKLPALPRMADAAVWVTASEPPGRRGRFIEALQDVRLTEAREAVQVDPVARAVLEWVAEWPDGSVQEFTPAGLYGLLTGRVSVNERQPPGWPRAPAVFGKELRRVAPLLRRAGVDVQWCSRRNQRGHGDRCVVVRKCVDGPVDRRR